MMQSKDKHLVSQAIKRHGGVENLPPAPDGPLVATFEPRAVAAAIEQEIFRARMNGWPRITIHMDLVDAAALANALKVR